MNGADQVAFSLRSLGIDTFFGLPGTQNLVLLDALRRVGLRCVTAVDEGGAAFMAAGYARASGRLGVLTTIPGPGFLYALAGIAEAFEDSTPILWLTLRQSDDRQAFPLQRLDHGGIAGSILKRCYLIERNEDVRSTLAAACELALDGEPGPVLVEIEAKLLVLDSPFAGAKQCDASLPGRSPDLGEFIDRVRSARRPVMFVGQGAQGASDGLRELVHRWHVPVLSTTGGRGVVPDDDPLALVHDFSFELGTSVPALIERCDLVLVLGCKFTHNGSAGGRLRLPVERLVRVDTSERVLAANYPASVAVCAEVEQVTSALLAADLSPSAWSEAELQQLHLQFLQERSRPIAHEPILETGDRSTSVAEVFVHLAQVLGEAAVYTTDAGLHQALARRYATIKSVRGLLCPSDFQSMGFGLAGAIGAAVARPQSTIVACVGDGALALALGELSTAAREGVNLIVLVFNDGAYGLIRRQQLLTFGEASSTDLGVIDYAALASAMGCSYFRIEGDVAQAIRAAAAPSGVRLVEISLSEAGSLKRHAFVRSSRERIVRAMPRSWRDTFKGLVAFRRVNPKD